VKNLKYMEILQKNKSFRDALSAAQVSVAVFSNITVHYISDILEYALRSNNVNVQVVLGDYDNILQDSEKYKHINHIVVFWEAANFIEGLQYKIELMSASDINSLLDKVKAELDFIFLTLTNKSLVVFNRFYSRVFTHNHLRRGNFDMICQELNAYLEKKAPRNFQLVDLDNVFIKCPIDNAIDFRYFYSSKALYTINFFKIYVEYIKPLLLSMLGRSKKAIIFDCDNTLWHGVLGEDGINGIEMIADTKKGVIYEEIQHYALALNRQGVLIGLCSKNNFQDVEEVFSNHPGMKIKNEHISVKKVNWQDKVTNLIEIAKELNIGMDSLVFIDDSDFEINLVRQQLPEVTVLQVPKVQGEYPGVFRDNMSLFYIGTSQSEEDLCRTKLYKDEEARSVHRNKFNNLEDYLRSLGLQIKIFFNKKEEISRISQLAQKTNQFNLTTKRYSEIDIANYMDDEKIDVISLSAKDRFGEYGIVGVCIVKLNNKCANIDTLLMSCRVIGRNIEFAFFNIIMAFLSKKGFDRVKSKYIKTQKNEQVKKLYDRLGFNVESYSDSEISYCRNINDFVPFYLDYIEVNDGKKT